MYRDPGKLPQRVINVVKVSNAKGNTKAFLREALRASDTLVPHVTKGWPNQLKSSRWVWNSGAIDLAIKPTPKQHAALEAEAREQLQRESTKPFTRVAMPPFEQNAPIPRNELNTEIRRKQKRQIREAADGTPNAPSRKKQHQTATSRKWPRRFCWKKRTRNWLRCRWENSKNRKPMRRPTAYRP